MSPEERETTVNIAYAVRSVSIYSTQKAVWTKARRAGWRLEFEDRYGKCFVAPIAQFRFSLRSAKSVKENSSAMSRLMKARRSPETKPEVHNA